MQRKRSNRRRWKRKMKIVFSLQLFHVHFSPFFFFVHHKKVVHRFMDNIFSCALRLKWLVFAFSRVDVVMHLFVIDCQPNRISKEIEKTKLRTKIKANCNGIDLSLWNVWAAVKRIKVFFFSTLSKNGFFLSTFVSAIGHAIAVDWRHKVFRLSQLFLRSQPNNCFRFCVCRTVNSEHTNFHLEMIQTKEKNAHFQLVCVAGLALLNEFSRRNENLSSDPMTENKFESE